MRRVIIAGHGHQKITLIGQHSVVAAAYASEESLSGYSNFSRVTFIGNPASRMVRSTTFACGCDGSSR